MVIFVPASYDVPFSARGRARTIAAFHVAQGNGGSLSKDLEMRRDVLNSLMSPRAVSYWLTEKGWLEKVRKVGNCEIVKLTSKGFLVCVNSQAGGSDVPITKELIEVARESMTKGGSGYVRKHFPEIDQSAVQVE